MNRPAIRKLEKLLTNAAEQAIREGYAIVSGTYHSNDKSCDPMFAACRKEKEEARKSSSAHIPQYEEIVAKKIQSRFLPQDLKSYHLGFDTDYPFDYPIFTQNYYVLDEDVFNLARKLRRRYISKQLSTLQQLTNKARNWLSRYASL